MVKIPEAVFSKYLEFADAMLDTSGFGRACKLVYTEEIEVIENNVPNIKQRKVMNLQDISPDSGFKRGNTSYKTVELTEDIVLRPYWDKKDFKKFGNIEVPDGSLMTIGHFPDLVRVNRAKALLINTDRTQHVEWRFTKIGEPVIYGLNTTGFHYFMCYWGRA